MTHALGAALEHRFWILLKGSFATRRAEIVGGPLMDRRRRRRLFVHGHPADRINRHEVRL